jgi:hypothetical protein
MVEEGEAKFSAIAWKLYISLYCTYRNLRYFMGSPPANRRRNLMAFINEVTLKKDGLHAYMGENGAFIGNGTPLLDCKRHTSKGSQWSPRPKHILRRLLETAYGCPVNVEAVHASLERVAKALNDGDKGVATIALLHANFTPLASISHAEKMRRADTLSKASVDDPVHPGWPAGTPNSLGGKYRNKNTPQIVRYFESVYPFIHEMAQRLHVNENWILALSAHESGYLEAHNYGLNNPFGLTHGGGSNVGYSSIEAAMKYWEDKYGDDVRGATSMSDFLYRLLHLKNGATYNKADPNWKNKISGALESVSGRKEAWLEERKK